MSKAPVRVAVTGAAGQIGYSLLFRIASGEMLGKDQPVILQLLDLPQAQKACQGVIMELDDCAFPLLAGVFATDNPDVAFKDADLCLLVGARPRTKGMERADLLTNEGGELASADSPPRVSALLLAGCNRGHRGTNARRRVGVDLLPVPQEAFLNLIPSEAAVLADEGVDQAGAFLCTEHVANE